MTAKPIVAATDGSEESLRAVEWALDAEGLSSDSNSLYGKGEMGILALYAGLFDARIQRVVLNDPPASHRRGPALPGFTNSTLPSSWMRGTCECPVTTTRSPGTGR